MRDYDFESDEFVYQKSGSYGGRSSGGNGNRRNTSGTGEFDLKSLLISLIGGVIGFVIANYVYAELRFQTIWRPLIIGTFFLVLAITLFIVAKLCARICGYYEASADDNIKAIAMILAVFVAATLFEFLYELNFDFKESQTVSVTKTQGFTSYVFMVDTTESMNWNDPDAKRGSAISEVMKKEPDAKYCVYTFDANAKLFHGMIKGSKVDTKNYRFENMGGTSIYNSLDMVLDDISAGQIAAGNRPLIILVSDGEDGSSFSENKINEIIKKANSLSATVSMIGLAYGDTNEMMGLVDGTGGVYKKIDDASELSNSYQYIIETAKIVGKIVSNDGLKRDLLNTRLYMEHDWIYAVERVVFLAAIAFMFTLLKSYQVRSGGEATDYVIPNILVIFLGALAIELGINALGYPEFRMRLLMSICFTVVLTNTVVYTPPKTDNNRGNYVKYWD